jgi:hypothetical protein
MIRANGFLQMFTVGGVGGGSLDFHLDTHHLIAQTDYGKQEEAREESKHSGSAVTIDRSGHTHIYERGCELASNESSGNRSEYPRDIDERT